MPVTDILYHTSSNVCTGTRSYLLCLCDHTRSDRHASELTFFSFKYCFRILQGRNLYCCNFLNIDIKYNMALIKMLKSVGTKMYCTWCNSVITYKL